MSQMINRRMVRWIFGNPLIAITMIRHDLTAGLFAPVEILVTEAEDGRGTTITYVRPSSLMVIGNNPPLMQAAAELQSIPPARAVMWYMPRFRTCCLRRLKGRRWDVWLGPRC